MIYRFNTITIKITARFFAATDELTLKFIWKSKQTSIAKIISLTINLKPTET